MHKLTSSRTWTTILQLHILKSRQLLEYKSDKDCCTSHLIHQNAQINPIL